MKYEVSDHKYKDFMKNIQVDFQHSTDSLYVGRNTLKRLHIFDVDIVVKSFKVPHFINKVAYTFFRASKAKKSYNNSKKIAAFTPEPIGYIEYFRFGLLFDSYYACKEYKYDFTIREPLVNNNFKNRDEIFRAFARFTYTLHNHHVEHLDYSPGNILIKQLESVYEFKIIDVNRMRFRDLSMYERIENFSKLWAKDEDLKVIASHYATLIEMNKDEAIKIALSASQKHKNRKNFKKRLKGKKVVD